MGDDPSGIELQVEQLFICFGILVIFTGVVNLRLLVVDLFEFTFDDHHFSFDVNQGHGKVICLGLLALHIEIFHLKVQNGLLNSAHVVFSDVLLHRICYIVEIWITYEFVPLRLPDIERVQVVVH